MEWELKTDRPIYAQIIEKFRHGIISGEYQAGEKLASVRELAQEASVNPNTMQKALAELERDGLVFTNRTSGRYITEDSELLMEIKREFLLEETKDFIAKMQKMGLSKEDIIKFISEMKD